MGPSMTLTIGHTAPDFHAQTTDGPIKVVQRPMPGSKVLQSLDGAAKTWRDLLAAAA